jgi:hypothetical protein
MEQSKITIFPIKFLGSILALTMSYQMWGWKGCLFVLGLLLRG